jgi:hypothetical protein
MNNPTQTAKPKLADENDNVFSVCRQASSRSHEFSQGELLELIGRNQTGKLKEFVFRSIPAGKIKIWTLEEGQHDCFDLLFQPANH